MAILEELLDMFRANTACCGGVATGNEAKKRLQVSLIGQSRIFCEPSLNNQVLQKKLKMLGVVVDLQGRVMVRGKNKRPDGTAVRAYGSEPSSHPVELAKFTQGLSSFATFFYAGFFVVFTPLQLSFNTIDLQFFLQLPDRVFKVTSDIYFDHDCITSFGGRLQPLVRVLF